MENFEHCAIIKEKVFWGFRSADPPKPFLLFLQKNIKNLKELLNNNQLKVIDEEGEEIPRSYWESNILSFYEEKMSKEKSKKQRTTIKLNRRQKTKFQKERNKKSKKIQGYKNEENSISKELQTYESLENEYWAKKQSKVFQKKLNKTQSKIQKLNKEITQLDKRISQL